MTDTANTRLQEMFNAGVHYGYRKSRRHPSTEKFIFGNKNNVEIFDLERVEEALDQVLDFVRNTAAQGKQILIVGGKLEARKAIREAGESLGIPFVAGRWVGGTITNFPIIKARVDRLEKLLADKEKGELIKYTKKERLLIDREIKRLDETFGGLRGMKELPAAVFVIDPKHEKTAVAEAHDRGIPVIALANSDCNISQIDHIIPGSDASVHSIDFFVKALAVAYREGALNAPKKIHTEPHRDMSSDSFSSRSSRDEIRGDRRDRPAHAPARTSTRS